MNLFESSFGIRLDLLRYWRYYWPLQLLFVPSVLLRGAEQTHS